MLLGGTLVPANDRALAITSGEVLKARWPDGLPPGTPVYFQAWFMCASSGLPGGETAATNALVTLSR